MQSHSTTQQPSSGENRRLRVTIRGTVQGVGFRPFVFRLATELGLAGWVNNSPQGVALEVEGTPGRLESFLLRLEPEKPPHASIQGLESAFLDPVGYTGFAIRASDDTGEKKTFILPDVAVCADCLREVFDPDNRRYLYPFTNCTHCGPRFSIIESLPYDRARTSMKRFDPCARCRGENENPRDRRFHAQPNACPDCGPHLELRDPYGKVLALGHAALPATAEAIRGGAVAAVKGLGGFQLIVDAQNDAAVLRLRRRKHRDDKPFALMCASLRQVKELCQVSGLEKRLLLSPESPIVLLRRKGNESSGKRRGLAGSIAPGNPYLGVMLPYTPLHHILLRELGRPVVATSGNLGDETICADETEALERLKGIADIFLVHNRPIVHPVDDSVARIMAGREMVLRRARGYAPLPVTLGKAAASCLAVGGHMKNSVAVGCGREVFISQHVGDLQTAQSFDTFKKVLSSLTGLYACKPKRVACDAHPDYPSSRFAEQCGLPRVRVQHHFAHVLSCMAENELAGSALGIAWDGSGYGPDGTVWGGEFLQVAESSFHRVACWRPFPLPGGEQAVREPRRAALGLLYELWGDAVFDCRDLAPVKAFSAEELRVMRSMLENKINCPMTSSVGRLFDAVAAITGVRQRCRFEGQAAMQLEFALEDRATGEAYPFRLVEPDGQIDPPPQKRDEDFISDLKLKWIIDWGPMVEAICGEVRREAPTHWLSAKFHNTLADAAVAVVRRAGERRVVLSGGCFQNKYLTERLVQRLRQERFCPYWHQRIPPNDGGLALGQILAAARR